jgi:hypothetical protein
MWMCVKQMRSWVVGAVASALGAALLSIAGCGSDGTASVTYPPTPVPGALVTGVVRLPNGQLASRHPFWQWAEHVRLLAPVYAATQNPSVFPAGGVRVTLVHVDHADAADGVIDSPQFLNNSLPTDGNGVYTVDSNARVDHVGDCGLMAQVGDAAGHTLTRAFVVAGVPAATNIDVVSETVVRVVLDRLTKGPAVQLCDFPLGSPGLQAITEAVSNAVFTATGSNVDGINQSAFAKAVANPGVQAAIDAATGVPVAE